MTKWCERGGWQAVCSQVQIQQRRSVRPRVRRSQGHSDHGEESVPTDPPCGRRVKSGTWLRVCSPSAEVRFLAPGLQTSTTLITTADTEKRTAAKRVAAT